MVGRQEAEIEVIIDRLIESEGDKDKALLFVVSQIPTEVKVRRRFSIAEVKVRIMVIFITGQLHTTVMYQHLNKPNNCSMVKP